MSSDLWLHGKVARGAGRGKKLGFPTANLELDDTTLRPAPGVYAGWVRLVDDADLPAAVHVGPAPTFNRQKSIVEVHLLDFPDTDLYEKTMSLRIVQRIRNIEKFATADELSAAIFNDCAVARSILETTHQSPGQN